MSGSPRPPRLSRRPRPARSPRPSPSPSPYSSRFPRLTRRRARLALPLLACALVAAVPQAPTTVPQGGVAGSARQPGPGEDGRSGWVLTSHDKKHGGSYRPYVGNGYLGQRVAPSGSGYSAGGEKSGWPLYTPRYDGSFVAGLFGDNQATGKNKQTLAAVPTWTGMDVATGGGSGETFSSDTPAARVSHYRQSLDMRHGLVRTSLTWTARDGRATDLTYEVLADRRHRHSAAVRVRMRPHWSGEARVTDVLDGRGARRVSQTGGGDRTSGSAARHGGQRTMDVAFRTHGTHVGGAVASTLRPGPGAGVTDDHKAQPAEKLTAKQGFSFTARKGASYEFTKYVGVDTAHTSGAFERSALTASRSAAARGWERIQAAHSAAWERLWHSDVRVQGRPELQKWLRSAQYGLLSGTRRGSDDSIAPAALTSDNYAGAIFWDAETWMYPGLLSGHPDLAASVLDYRYRTREGARANARKLGYKGLFYGWTSGRDGDLWKECHSWDPPHCRTQNHLQSDIALAAWQYYLATGDRAWLRERGWPLLKGIAEFWTSRVHKNGDGSYSIRDVAGPDEYSNGVDDGVFTNAGAATSLRHAARAARLLGEEAPKEWTRTAGKLRIPYDKKNKVFEQYDGYGGSTIKQADTVLLQYPLEWPMSKADARRTLDYYASRTDPDGPAMTDSVHAVDAAENGEPGCSAYTYLKRSVEPFMRSPFALFSEARGEKAGAADPHSGQPAQDFVTGKGGFLQVFTHGLTGQRLREGALKLDPMLPPQLSRGVTLTGQHWQGRTYDVELGAEHTTVRLTHGEPFTVETPQGKRTVGRGAPAVLETRRPDREPTANLARCRKTSASSQESGMYASAAVDGNAATSWTPDGKKGSLTVRLARTADGARVEPQWEGKPAGHRIQVSADGRHWRDAGGDARPLRYVRVTVTSKDAEKPAGIEELRVTERK
ncbi:trehalose/maltose hydrolase-like predicted phosphorylase [Streptomyces sp. Amel2xB2]|uniref:glycosyl hydrolase family 65 protein n=1 Tax=Streptomyces sp. Amel2xB2 TaxID=1305829 RepID=UPI000DBABE99|nr:glycosyl hydrolase family 65 protein [Streptomyces sp. Amel2xB2]RAJ69799.1 trehalose/maltose hydrolase-like predicted phosphorylase [Streptomyces sp. Amel2xB2]